MHACHNRFAVSLTVKSLHQQNNCVTSTTSVRLSATLVDYDHIEVVLGKRQEISVSLLPTFLIRPRSYHPEFYCAGSVGYGQLWSFALRRHPTARMSRYLIIC